MVTLPAGYVGVVVGVGVVVVVPCNRKNGSKGLIRFNVAQ